MELRTVIRIHGVIDASRVKSDILADSLVLKHNGDEEINSLLATGWDIVEVNTIFNPETCVLFDITYLTKGAEDDDDDDDDDMDDLPNGPDGLQLELPLDMVSGWNVKH